MHAPRHCCQRPTVFFNGTPFVVAGDRHAVGGPDDRRAVPDQCSGFGLCLLVHIQWLPPGGPMAHTTALSCIPIRGASLATLTQLVPARLLVHACMCLRTHIHAPVRACGCATAQGFRTGIRDGQRHWIHLCRGEKCMLHVTMHAARMLYIGIADSMSIALAQAIT